MNRQWVPVVAVVLLALVVPQQGVAKSKALSLGELEKQFQELPMEARRLTGPLFWLHGDESPERLEMYVGKVAEGGNGCFTAESRPHVDWLGEGWYRDLEVCLEAAKKHNLQMWIFDEKWWPSGEVGGKVPPEYSSKRMVATAKEVSGPSRFVDSGFGGAQFIVAIAGKDTGEGIDGESLVDLSPYIQDGTLDWEAPAGKWKIMRFAWEPGRKKEAHGRNLLVDGASQDCVDWYLQTVYQPHYDRFKEDFGKSIVGYFYDEPETPGDWGTEVIPLLQKRRVDWKRALVAWKFQLAGEEQAAARYQYQDAFAEAWGQTLFGGMSRWCRDHDVLSIGHFLEHRWEYLNPELCAGNMFQLMKYSDMGAIDAVFRQFAPGQRDPGLWQTPKLGSSITHVYGKPDDITMVEIYGARGQDVSYPEMKWWANHMHVSGVNFFIPHSFNPRAPFDTDCPPYFYNGGYEPRWPLYRVLADYTSRLSVMLTGGRHVCPVALLYLGNSRHVGKSVTPEQMSTALQDALYDCDWMPYDVFDKDARLREGEIRLHQERYRVLIVPPVEVIPYDALAKAKSFYNRGGVVVGYGFLPSRSATLGRSSEEIASLCEAIWGEAQPGLGVCKTNASSGRSYFLPEQPTPEELQQVLTEDAGVEPVVEVLEGRTGHWLHALHRVKAGRDVFFICNQNVDGEARRFRLSMAADGYPECWDALRGEINSIPCTRHGGKVELTLTLEPLEGVLLVFQAKKRDLPVRIEPGTFDPVRWIPILQDESPVVAVKVPEVETDNPLADCRWVWYPEGTPAADAPPGVRFFRKRFDLPAGRQVKAARFVGTADNILALYVNGEQMEGQEQEFRDWRVVSKADVTDQLKRGMNLVAIAVTNESDRPNPAGLLGKLIVEFEEGRPLALPIDRSWKTSDREAPGWNQADFDDAKWQATLEGVAYGAGPWGRVGGKALTLGPVLSATSFVGHFEIPASVDLAGLRAYVEMDELAPEVAARLSVNAQDAGGFIGKPLRAEVTQYLRPGNNTLSIAPFAPGEAWLALYPR